MSGSFFLQQVWHADRGGDLQHDLSGVSGEI